MNRRIFVSVMAAFLMFAAGCTTTGPSSGNPESRRRSIDAGVDNALAELYRQVAGAEQLVGRSRGVLVFPSVLEAGFVFGAARGEGALRVGGRTQSYHATTSGTFGWMAGAQSTAVFVLFMTDQALANFQNSRGWTVGADASVTLVSVGAGAQMSTATVQQPVIGFVLVNRGLMGGISLDGTRITRLDL
ncbi:MAG: YSC84-related protein [Deltaproteobacteria bacterium]|nr:YSC84-related protein [Deltaproteobacteria bacterium]